MIKSWLQNLTSNLGVLNFSDYIHFVKPTFPYSECQPYIKLIGRFVLDEYYFCYRSSVASFVERLVANLSALKTYLWPKIGNKLFFQIVMFDCQYDKIIVV